MRLANLAGQARQREVGRMLTFCTRTAQGAYKQQQGRCFKETNISQEYECDSELKLRSKNYNDETHDKDKTKAVKSAKY